MVSSYHGHIIDLASLRRKFPISLKGLNLQQLVRLASELKLAARALRAEVQDLTRIALPAILHWDLNHFVVLTGVRTRSFEIHDPSKGVVHLSAAEFSRHFTGVLLELTPTGTFIKKTERRRYSVWALWRNVRGIKSAAAHILVLALSLEIFALLAPLYQQFVIDHAILSGDRNLLVVLAIGFLILLIIQIIINAARSWALLYFGAVLSTQMIRQLFDHLLRLPLDFFQRRHLGDITSRFGSLEAIQRTMTASFLAALIDGLLVVGTITLMFVYSAALAGVVLAAVLLYALMRVVVYSPLRSASEATLVAAADQQSHFLESIRGVATLKLFNQEGPRCARFGDLIVDRVNAEVSVQRLSILFQFGNGLLFGLENVLVIFVAAVKVLDGSFTIGMMFAFAGYKLQFVQRASGLIDKVLELRMLGLHAERIADIALADAEGSDGGPPIFSNAGPVLAVRDVAYRYGASEKPTISGISLEVRQGEVLAITGPSGCGKSTLLKLLVGLLRPDSGAIFLRGQDISSANSADCRAELGVVMQDDSLFAGSIQDNISFFDASADLQSVIQSAKDAALHDDVLKMPMQYNTLIGDMGSALSGGQRQRLILARALYKQPSVLILDEATSHLDVLHEAVIHQSLRRLGITVVLVAHRPESIRLADRVFTL